MKTRPILFSALSACAAVLLAASCTTPATLRLAARHAAETAAGR